MEIDVWFRDFVLQLRNKLDEIPEEDQKYLGNLEDFTPPCQVYILWVQDKNGNDLQLISTLHEKEDKDVKIDSYGPYNIITETDQLDMFFNREEFSSRISENNKNFTVNEIIKRAFLQALEISSPRLGKGSASMLDARNNFYWIWFGRIQDSDPNELITRILSNLHEHKRSILMVEDFTPPEMKEGLGGFIDSPPLWIGNVPILSQEQEYSRVLLNHFISIPIITMYKGRHLLISRDGYFVLSYLHHTKTEFPTYAEIIRCYKNLQEILASLLLMGYPINDLELSRLTIFSGYYPDSETIQYSYSQSQTNLFDQRLQPFDKDSFKSKRIITEVVMRTAIRTAELISHPEKLGELPVILLQCRFQLYKHNYSISLLLSWTIIEQFLSMLWKHQQDDWNYSRIRRKRLNSNSVYTAAVKLEILEMIGYIKTEELLEITKFRKLRNGFIHELKEITRLDATECFEMSKKLLYRWMRVYLHFS